nr:SDR family oxidoreductase [Sinobaca qinghaiensis]
MERKRAVITGVSHNNGIGAAICRELAAKEIDIFFVYWQSEDGFADGFEQEMLDAGVSCRSMELDLALPDAAEKLLDAVYTACGPPDILVNNAAYSTRDGYENLTAEMIDRHYEVNMRTTMLLSTMFARRFQGSEGRIIIMTSGQEQGPMPGELAYIATKGALSAFTLSFSAEAAPLGITVNAVDPGPTDSGWMDEQTKALLEPKFGRGRLGRPRDAARLVAFLAGEEASWITGQVIHSEGGFLRS